MVLEFTAEYNTQQQQNNNKKIIAKTMNRIYNHYNHIAFIVIVLHSRNTKQDKPFEPNLV